MQKVIFFLMIAGSVCRAQDASWEFLCEGHSNWVSTIKFITTADRIRFIGPLDQSYGNPCEAQKGGELMLVIDSTNHSVELRVDPPFVPYVCPRNYDPVYSMAVEFGPLIVGDWVFWSSAYQFTNSFAVYPDPGPFQQAVSFETGQVVVECPAVAYLRYELETSANLTDWQSAQVDYVLDGSLMRWRIKPEAQRQFFRIKRSSITQIVTSYPTDCGQ